MTAVDRPLPMACWEEEKDKDYCLVYDFMASILNAELLAMRYTNMVHQYGTPIWRPQNSAKFWHLLWLCRPLTICPEQTNIYINTFPNTLTS